MLADVFEVGMNSLAAVDSDGVQRERQGADEIHQGVPGVAVVGARVDARDQELGYQADHQHAIDAGCFVHGVSTVIGFPKGAGKSAVSAMKITATILSGRNAIFLAPTHSLVEQTVRDLRRAFPTATV